MAHLSESRATRKKTLNIALVAPLVSPIAPPFLGGAQVMLNDLAHGLAERGHNVTLYAARGSRVEGVRVIESPVDSEELKSADFNNPDKGGTEIDTAFYKQGQLFLQIFLDINHGKYDIAHAHAFDWPVFALAPLCRIPTVHTVHLPFVDKFITGVIQTAFEKLGSSYCVTVSRTCAETYARYFPFDRVIYNGIAVDKIPFGERGEDFLLFAGRMAPEKGPDYAINIALRAGKKLVLAGGIYDRDFFDREIAPRLAENPGRLEYRGALSRDEVYRLMARAAGVIFPSRWQEPFGLVLAEAQTAGAPAIAFETGATREIIVPGETGFLVPPGDVDAAARAVAELGNIDRAACRQRIATNFTIDKMLDDYEDYYYSKLRMG